VVSHGAKRRDIARQPVRPPALSAREREVLGLLCEGLCDKLIARRLGIAPKTATNHVHKVLRKTGAASRSQAIVKALRP
jgi:two-component system nitrate/nitrite response regulator NarL